MQRTPGRPEDRPHTPRLGEEGEHHEDQLNRPFCRRRTRRRSALASGALAAQDTKGKAEGKKTEDTANKEKHTCKGQNACAGKGGCKAGDKGCAGKNSCKGKGGCAGAQAKHECKGHNACKGMGGCKSGDAGCAGKNSCKAAAAPFRQGPERRAERDPSFTAEARPFFERASVFPSQEAAPMPNT
jgi:hypothetical protein